MKSSEDEQSVHSREVTKDSIIDDKDGQAERTDLTMFEASEPDQLEKEARETISVATKENVGFGRSTFDLNEMEKEDAKVWQKLSNTMQCGEQPNNQPQSHNVGKVKDAADNEHLFADDPNKTRSIKEFNNSQEGKAKLFSLYKYNEDTRNGSSDINNPSKESYTTTLSNAKQQDSQIKIGLFDVNKTQEPNGESKKSPSTVSRQESEKPLSTVSRQESEKPLSTVRRLEEEDSKTFLDTNKPKAQFSADEEQCELYGTKLSRGDKEIEEEINENPVTSQRLLEINTKNEDCFNAAGLNHPDNDSVKSPVKQNEEERLEVTDAIAQAKEIDDPFSRPNHPHFKAKETLFSTNDANKPNSEIKMTLSTQDEKNKAIKKTLFITNETPGKETRPEILEPKQRSRPEVKMHQSKAENLDKDSKKTVFWADKKVIEIGEALSDIIEAEELHKYTLAKQQTLNIQDEQSTLSSTGDLDCVKLSGNHKNKIPRTNSSTINQKQQQTKILQSEVNNINKKTKATMAAEEDTAIQSVIEEQKGMQKISVIADADVPMQMPENIFMDKSEDDMEIIWQAIQDNDVKEIEFNINKDQLSKRVEQIKVICEGKEICEKQDANIQVGDEDSVMDVRQENHDSNGLSVDEDMMLGEDKAEFACSDEDEFELKAVNKQRLQKKSIPDGNSANSANALLQLTPNQMTFAENGKDSTNSLISNNLTFSEFDLNLEPGKSIKKRFSETGNQSNYDTSSNNNLDFLSTESIYGDDDGDEFSGSRDHWLWRRHDWQRSLSTSELEYINPADWYADRSLSSDCILLPDRSGTNVTSVESITFVFVGADTAWPARRQMSVPTSGPPYNQHSKYRSEDFGFKASNSVQHLHGLTRRQMSLPSYRSPQNHQKDFDIEEISLNKHASNSATIQQNDWQNSEPKTLGVRRKTVSEIVCCPVFGSKSLEDAMTLPMNSTKQLNLMKGNDEVNLPDPLSHVSIHHQTLQESSAYVCAAELHQSTSLERLGIRERQNKCKNVEDSNIVDEFPIENWIEKCSVIQHSEESVNMVNQGTQTTKGRTLFNATDSPPAISLTLGNSAFRKSMNSLQTASSRKNITSMPQNLPFHNSVPTLHIQLSTRSIETQTYPNVRAIETQTSPKVENIWTQFSWSPGECANSDGEKEHGQQKQMPPYAEIDLGNLSQFPGIQSPAECISHYSAKHLQFETVSSIEDSKLQTKMGQLVYKTSEKDVTIDKAIVQHEAHPPATDQEWLKGSESMKDSLDSQNLWKDKKCKLSADEMPEVGEKINYLRKLTLERVESLPEEAKIGDKLTYEVEKLPNPGFELLKQTEDYALTRFKAADSLAIDSNSYRKNIIDISADDSPKYGSFLSHTPPHIFCSSSNHYTSLPYNTTRQCFPMDAMETNHHIDKVHLLEGGKSFPREVRTDQTANVSSLAVKNLSKQQELNDQQTISLSIKAGNGNAQDLQQHHNSPGIGFDPEAKVQHEAIKNRSQEGNINYFDELSHQHLYSSSKKFYSTDEEESNAVEPQSYSNSLRPTLEDGYGSLTEGQRGRSVSVTNKSLGLLCSDKMPQISKDHIEIPRPVTGRSADRSEFREGFGFYASGLRQDCFIQAKHFPFYSQALKEQDETGFFPIFPTVRCDYVSDELERLRTERCHFLGLLSKDVITSKMRVEHSEATLNEHIAWVEQLLKALNSDDDDDDDDDGFVL